MSSAVRQRVVVLLGGVQRLPGTACSQRPEVVASTRPQQLHLVGRPQEYQSLHVDLGLLIFLTTPPVKIIVGSARLSLEVSMSLDLLQVIVDQHAGKFLLLPWFSPLAYEVLLVSAGSEVVLVLNGLWLQRCS